MTTPITRPRRSLNPVTVAPNTNVAPPSFAPFASESAASPGLTVPSVGTNVAPSRSPTSAAGHRERTSGGASTCVSMPASRAIETAAWSSCIRPGVRATVSAPTRRNPVSIPVSRRSDAYSGALILLSSVRACVPRTWATRPAACQVVPAVSLARSSTTTSATPSFVRW